MPKVDGTEVVRRLAGHPTAPAVVVLTTFDVDEYVYAALRHGAAGRRADRRPDAEGRRHRGGPPAGRPPDGPGGGGPDDVRRGRVRLRGVAPRSGRTSGRPTSRCRRSTAPRWSAGWPATRRPRRWWS